MDGSLQSGLSENGLTYKKKLKGILDKYSKIPCHDGADLEWSSTSFRSIARHMTQAKVQLKEWESKSPTDFGEDSLRFQDTLGDSQLDLTNQNCEVDKTCASTTQYSVQHDGMASVDTTVSSLDEGQSYLSDTEFLPEDQDEELEMTLRSNSSSLGELYPNMINQIGRVWHRHYVTEAADSVLRRYRRWRQQSHRSNLSNTFIVPQRNPKNMISQTLLRKDTISPAKRPHMWAETLRSPLKVEYMQDWQAQRQSPQRMRREQHQPVLVMDMSEYSMPNEILLNETFTVSEEVSQLEEHPSTYTFSPSRPYYPTGRASLDPSLRPRRLSLTAHSPHTNGCSVRASETMAAMERSDIYGSPVRQSPSRGRVTSSLSRSPHAFSRSPRAHSMESFSREPPRHRLLSVPPQMPTVPLRMLHPQNSPHSLHSQLRSPQPASAPEGRHRLRRHLSFDSLPTSRVSFSPKKLDEDLLKLYHQLVCQNKSSPFNGHPCRLCARSSEANKRPSSSNLAALALSPHCSVLRKRHRELNWDNQPQSKRVREAYCPSSPTSREMLRRRLYASEREQSHDGLFDRSTYPSMLQRFSPQQRSADARQETWMSRRHHVFAADFSSMGTGTGSSHERRMASGSSRREWV